MACNVPWVVLLLFICLLDVLIIRLKAPEKCYCIVMRIVCFFSHVSCSQIEMKMTLIFDSRFQSVLRGPEWYFAVVIELK